MKKFKSSKVIITALLVFTLLIMVSTLVVYAKPDNTEAYGALEQASKYYNLIIQRISKKPQLIEKSEYALSTFCQIKIYHESEEIGKEILSKAFRNVHDIENTMSNSIEGSDIYLLNQKAGNSPVKVSPSTLDVLNTGIDYYDITKGAFNIGIGSLTELWGIGNSSQKVPTPEEIQQAKAHIDLQQLEVSNQVFIKDPQMRVDIGGIAQGYVIDNTLELLKKEGVESGFIYFGGDVYALGKKLDGTPWLIGIQSPEIGDNSVIAAIPVENQSIATSGDYERYFIQNNIQYHHILDPDTGYPTQNELSSVTVLSDTSIEGDILSTAVFVMGLEEGLNFLENRKGVEGILITKDNKVYTTSGVKDKIEILNKNYRLVKSR